MKALAFVILSLLVLTTSSLAAPAAQPQQLSASEVNALLGPYTLQAASPPAASSQASASSLAAQSTGEPQALLDVRDITAQRRADLLNQPGWLHVQTRNTQVQPDPLSPVSAGLDTFVQDQWLELDASGRVRSAVRRTMREDGKTFQVSLLEGNSWVNLTLGAQSPASAFDPDYGFDALAAGLVGQGYALNKSILYKECWYQGDKYTISDGRLLHEAVFNTGYRTLRWIKTWRIAANGDISLVDSLEVMVEERAAQPPADVAAVLRQAPLLQ